MLFFLLKQTSLWNSLHLKITACGEARMMVTSHAPVTINLGEDVAFHKDAQNKDDDDGNENSPCSTTLPPTVQWRKRIADADVPEYFQFSLVWGEEGLVFHLRMIVVLMMMTMMTWENLSTLSTMSMREERMYPPVRIIIKTLQATFPACHWNIQHYPLHSISVPITSSSPSPQWWSSSWSPWAWWWKRWLCLLW